MCSGKETMHLSIRWMKVDCLPMDVPGDETVFGLKCHINKRISMPPEHQWLIFRGGLLEDQAMLQLYGVATGSVVYMVPNKGAIESLKRSHSNAALHSLHSNPQGSMSIGDLRFAAALKNLKEDDFTFVSQRNRDLRMNQCETRPGKYMYLEKTYHQLSAFWEKQHSSPYKGHQHKTVIPPKCNAPCEDPLPNPWAI